MTKTINKKEVGQRIKKIRLEMGYTQSEFAKITGSTLPAVSNWEVGKNLPSSKRLTEVAFHGQMTVDELLNGAYCNWWLDDNESNTYASSCRDNELFQLSEGTPEENRMRYCMYCGKKLKTIDKGVNE